MKKLFRFHRGSLADSLATTIEVSGLAELQKKIEAQYPLSFMSNIRIDPTPHKDSRLPEEWGGVSYYVVADFDGYEGQCIGMSNFYEKLVISKVTHDGNSGYQLDNNGCVTVWDKRTAEEKAQDKQELRRTAFLTELKALLGKYDAKISPNGYEVDGVIIDIADDYIHYNMNEYSPMQELTADNVFDYDKD